MTRIAILGAGALGSLYAYELSKVPSNSCFFIADGDRAKRLKKALPTVNGARLRAEVREPNEGSPADLLIVSLKYHHLQEALASALPFVGEQTTIISVMNGVDSEEIIAARFGQDHVVHCVALGMDALRENGKVHYTTCGRLVIGRPEKGRTDVQEDRDIGKIETVCRGSGIGLEVSDDILKSLWWKFMINIGVNQISAITGASYRFFQDRKSPAHALMNDTMKEVVLVAQKKGIGLDETDIAAWYTVLDSLGPDNKTSMLQDVEAGRKTEVEMFAGILLKLGKEVGLDLPINSFILKTILSIEGVAGK
ncbi:ketopantoate reductase family protein [Sediminispirochaeta smaragdinae]|uniref:2-dehydropantoate 2-reductase n=1 Tax=Sediminispirochaeta smaragdinae (strain DSM 11293 / JCM 15392 / SEBR 4228) TaxID=573413 RepID=E1RBA3_SEDSS|nr:ketopantoate reductase family protein [Sediminispirochaeta smaragdinae]ADK79633.1 2-dehydropantoate 2-reductase [Sediminispirochaeta smaragdinae DSM 11293]